MHADITSKYFVAMAHWPVVFVEGFRKVTKYHLFPGRILHISLPLVHFQGAHLITQTKCQKRIGWKGLILEPWKELGPGERWVSSDGRE